MTEQEALQIAGRCWCDTETEHLVMDTDLAKAFAKRLIQESEALKTEVHKAFARYGQAGTQLHSDVHRLL